MKSFKDKCIDAVNSLIADYKNGYHAFDKYECSLCSLYWAWNIDKDSTDCKGCPNTAFLHRKSDLADDDDTTHNAGCYFRSSHLSSTPFKYHLRFWREAKTHLLTLDPKCFTPSKSKPSDFTGLLKIDRRVYKKSPLYKTYKDHG